MSSARFSTKLSPTRLKSSCEQSKRVSCGANNKELRAGSANNGLQVSK